jgi:hypothetical protein
MGRECREIFDVAGEHDAVRFRTGNDDGVHRGARRARWRSSPARRAREAGRSSRTSQVLSRRFTANHSPRGHNVPFGGAWTRGHSSCAFVSRVDLGRGHWRSS